jgi:membrane protein insertase Oxa1/YidC/SpoIIIJ
MMQYLTCLFSFLTLDVQERIQLETARLYKQAGVNPLAGKPCLTQEGSLAWCAHAMPFKIGI